MSDEQTDNIGLTQPEIGKPEGWGIDWNENAAEIDSQITILDTDSSKGNYTAHSTALYVATDTGKIYRGNGSNWQLIDLQVDELVAASATLGATTLQATLDANGNNISNAGEVDASSASNSLAEDVRTNDSVASNLENRTSDPSDDPNDTGRQWYRTDLD
ncbi:hypothetical protein [Halostagnicola kamekurae]|uniref:Uncharacterized protein n=1 Tax=Halostagnicola kamekurae TaxID=619731 RepID=A0A1I6RER6_9EURY|nr:hypothetical protein [Halostagnicola kamekurae]SFS63237.1 hypothetical protein SAMN04488556_1745 [Halostagnicola kamekurae]